MTDRVRIIKHEAVPQSRSFEVRFAAGRESKYFYWDHIPSRRTRPGTLTREDALVQANALARAERAAARRVRGFSPRVSLSHLNSRRQPLIRRHSRSLASAFSRTAAEGRLCHLLPQGEKGQRRLRRETYSAVCSRISATSFAVSLEPLVPNRAVT